MAVTKLFDEALEGLRFFERVEILTLNIFN